MRCAALALALAACSPTVDTLAPPDAAGSLGDADAPGGPICQGAGTFCGGHGLLGGDPGTLYYCGNQPGTLPGSSTKCADGCAPGAPDACKSPMPMGGGPTCPGPGDYCGGDMLQGDPGTLYHCNGASQAPASSTACASGCQVEPPGTNDLCKAALHCPGAGDWCGADGVGGDVDTLYHCDGAGNVTSQTACPNGCAVMAMGVPDVCKQGLTCPGAGDYCGADGVQGGDANTLYHCPGAGQPPSSSEGCANGCSIQPQGVPDFCLQKLDCPGAGDYCGNDGVGGAPNVLYHCNGANQPPASSTTCVAGCNVQPMGVPDFCNAQGCTQLGQAALNWEANQLNTGHCWCGLCLGFVNNAFAAAGNSPAYLHLATAADSLDAARATGKFVNWNGSCPCGAILYWDANQCNGEDGHVVICNGDGTVSTSGWNGFAGATHATITWLDGMECGHTPAGYILP